MAEPGLDELVADTRNALRTFERRVAFGSLPDAALADFKSGVGEVRLQLWSIMAAASSSAYDSVRERLRLRRTMTLLTEISRDIQAGTLSKEHPELGSLLEAARNLVAASSADPA